MKTTLDTTPRRYTDPRRIAAFMDTLTWAGVTLTDDGDRLTVHGDTTGLLQREVDVRVAGIRQVLNERTQDNGERQSKTNAKALPPMR